MDILSKLFGSASRVKIMRLFLFNPAETFGLEEVAEWSKVSLNEAKEETLLLQKASLIKKKVHFKGPYRSRASGWVLDSSFPYLNELKNLLINTVLLKNDDLVGRLGRLGRVRLIIIAGLFLQEPEDSRVDLLIVGDNIRKNALGKVIRSMESEIGKELRYTALDTADFQYRVSICDKLVKDILDYPHIKVMDKIGVDA